MAYNIEFKFEKLNRCRQFVREFSLYSLSKANVMKETQSSYKQFRDMMATWLKDYLCKNGYKSSTRYILAMDSRDHNENPLAIFLKSKEIIGSELAAHFGILFALADGNYKPTSRLNSDVKANSKRLLAVLKEYEQLGLIERRNVQNRFEYRLIKPDFDLRPYFDMFTLFGEIDPLGIIGHFINDRNRAKFNVLPKSPFRFKHHFLHHIMDAEILETLLTCIQRQIPVRIKLYHWIRNHEIQYHVPVNYRLIDSKDKIIDPAPKASKCWLSTDIIPIKIYASVRTGQRYLIGYYLGSGDFAAVRIDRIEEASPITSTSTSEVLDIAQYKARFAEEAHHLWGVSAKHAPQTVHVEFEIITDHPKSPILTRLESEKRIGKVERISPYSARFIADVYDGRELFPWMLSFVGHILRVSFSDPSLNDAWEQQLQETK